MALNELLLAIFIFFTGDLDYQIRWYMQNDLKVLLLFHFIIRVFMVNN